VPRDLLRAHARLLAVVLLARALAPDVLFAADSWARTAAMGACVAAGLLAARTGRALRLPALLLLAAVVGGWVYRRTGLSAWALVAAAVALAAGTAATLVKRRPPAPPPSDGGSDAAAAEAPASSPA
jgi:hypothetical protein